MKNVSTGQVSKGKASVKIGPAGKPPPEMPRVGGHTSNITPTQGVK